VFKDEGISGAAARRPALLRCLKKLEHGDTLTAWKLDRPAGHPIPTNFPPFRISKELFPTLNHHRCFGRSLSDHGRIELRN